MDLHDDKVQTINFLIRREVSALPLLENFIIRHLFAIGDAEELSVAELAEELGQSEEAILNFRDKAYATLKKRLAGRLWPFDQRSNDVVFLASY